ncbi:MAG: GH116 family glycosyl hydrolase, partial [Gemmatimonadota bacterium]
AVEQIAPQLPALEADTVQFVRAFCDTDLPEVAKEAALFNLSTLRSQTCFRTPDGRFYGFEGCGDRGGCCHGSCTHVWNYEQATAFLFGDLARMMREVEFLHATAENGLMSFRVHLPLERALDSGKAAADGQMGCIAKAYREWQLCGDDEWLRQVWPGVKRAVEFCWIPGGWDADRDGVMEGCQHNTMDVEYYGPNPQMGAWYLCALRAAEEMAGAVGDEEFALECRRLFGQGSRWMDEHLFNGEYYEHEVRPPARPEDVAEGLRVGAGAADVTRPDYQLAEGCLVDQLVGQVMAHVCGLGYLLRPTNVRKTHRSILKHNLRRSLHGHFNILRSYALGDEAALLMASYPKGRPANPFPYFTEVMTGFEYAAAVGMLYEGQVSNGLQCLQYTRDRYDGRKRSPFDEAECGHHYARAMIAWAAHLALSGFHYSGVTGTMTFGASNGRWFWSNGAAWGTCRIKGGAGRKEVELVVLRGELTLARLVLTGLGDCQLTRPARLRPGRAGKYTVKEA